MHIVFDKGSSQVQVDLETGGKRLKTLFDAITAEGWTFAIGPDRIDGAALQGADCLAILTRRGATQRGTTNPFPADWDFSFTSSELQAVGDFVNGGGGLLLISNHGPFSAGSFDWTVNDRVLAAQFGVTINPAAYQSPEGRTLTMSGIDLNPAQSDILRGVTSIVPHNSCAVSTGDPADFIAHIPANAKNSSPIFKNGPAGESYAVTAGSGRIIVGGNSGIAGSEGTNYPASGLIDAGGNKQFLLNALRVAGARGTPR
jgi:hypothetical protein